MMWLPTRIYEALPAVYVGMGALLLLGALYIGGGSELMLGYMTVGSSCVIAGFSVTYMRRKSRSQIRTHKTQ